jgi:hypothetical protein
VLDFASNAGIDDRASLFMVACRGVFVMVTSPRDTVPRPGTYHVTAGSDFQHGTATVDLHSPIVTTGHWPLATTGATLQGYRGTVQIDSVRRRKAWGRFDFRARRQSKGLG